MLSLDLKHDVVTITPAAGVVGATFCGIPLSDWTYILTCFYILVMVVLKIHAHFRKGK